MAAKSRRGRISIGLEITVSGPATITILPQGEFMATNHRDDDPPPRIRRNSVDAATAVCNNSANVAP